MSHNWRNGDCLIIGSHIQNLFLTENQYIEVTMLVAGVDRTEFRYAEGEVEIGGAKASGHVDNQHGV